MSRYTLLIPTYNRPQLLRCLLGYLAACGFEHPIGVLDSSTPDIVALNREFIKQLSLNIAHHVYDSSIHPYAKYLQGIDTIDSTYCSFCADDDVLLTDSLLQQLDFLDVHPAFVAAHGCYFGFTAGSPFEIRNIMYANPSIDADDAVQRVAAQMRDYQAIFYAVYRTPVLRSVLRRIQGMKSLLALELLSSSLTLVAGRVHRSQSIYMGRSDSPSIATSGWHPLQFFANDPASLFREYVAYRAVLLETLATNDGWSSYDSTKAQMIIDLSHLQYLAPMLASPEFSELIVAALRGELACNKGGTYVFPTNPQERYKQNLSQRVIRALRKEGMLGVMRRRRFFHSLKILRIPHASPSLVGVNVRRSTRTGERRNYRLYGQLFNAKLVDGSRLAVDDVKKMLKHLDNYV